MEKYIEDLNNKMDEVLKEWFPLIDLNKECDGSCSGKCDCINAIGVDMIHFAEIEASNRLRKVFVLTGMIDG
jgi:hypothetical protein